MITYLRTLEYKFPNSYIPSHLRLYEGQQKTLLKSLTSCNMEEVVPTNNPSGMIKLQINKKLKNKLSFYVKKEFTICQNKISLQIFEFYVKENGTLLQATRENTHLDLT